MALDPVTALFDIGSSIISRVWPDPAQQSDALLKLEKLKQDGDLAAMESEVKLLTGQLDINLEEAKHPSIFIAGWRPFVGWVGGFSLAYAGILEPLMRFIATTAGYTGAFPIIDTSATITILMGMLGMGAMRSFDKTKGNHTSRTGT